MDRRFDDKNNQKKTQSIFGSSVITYTAGAVKDELFTLPNAALVRSANIVVLTAGTVGEKVSIKLGSTVVAADMAIATLGVTTAAINKYFATGGVITVEGTLTGTPSIRIEVEYVEMDLCTGEYTD